MKGGLGRVLGSAPENNPVMFTASLLPLDPGFLHTQTTYKEIRLDFYGSIDCDFIFLYFVDTRYRYTKRINQWGSTIFRRAGG